MLSFPPSKGADVISVTLRGPATTDSLLAILAEIERTARERSATRVLIDETDLELTLLSVDDIRTLVEAWSRCPTLRESFIAVLAMRPVIYGINRMAQAFSHRAEKHIAVLRTRDAALAWLRAQ